jgi:hypothetical protein
MPNSSQARLMSFALALTALPVSAQQAAQGFAVDRFYMSAPGAGWWIMDALDMGSGWGGSLSLSMDYARDPLRVSDGSGSLAVVSDEAVLDFGAAVTYRGWRLYGNVDAPVFLQGQSGVAAGESFTAPSVTIASNPDTVSDPRLGLDIRLLGDAAGPFRLGLSGQLFVPNGVRAAYDTDGTFRAMFRVLGAGNYGSFSYAGQLGLHVRPLSDTSTPGSPQGSELLFGLAAGKSFSVDPGWNLVAGIELFGDTALRSAFGSGTTGIECLASARAETLGSGPQIRVKVGIGAGLDPQFGAPLWRAVLGIEYFNRG